MKLPVSLNQGTINQYTRFTKLTSLLRISYKIVLALFILLLIYKFIPNPYICYGYKPIKIGNQAIEFDWTGEFYQCRFDIANSGILAVKDPILHIYFIDGATTIIDPLNKEWQKNDDINYFWTKNISIAGGIHKMDFAERAYPISVIFHKKGINRIGYIINSNGIQKKGVIKVINKH